MYAIIENGGKQYKVSQGDIIQVEKVTADTGSEVTIDTILMVVKDGATACGSPYVNGARVIATVENSGKGKKVIVHKQRPRKVYRKLRGHRQPFTALKIKEIVSGG